MTLFRSDLSGPTPRYEALHTITLAAGRRLAVLLELRGMPADATHRAAVLGAGSWGTALAVHLGHIGHDVTLWGRDHALLAEMATRRANPTYLPDLTFPEAVRPTPSLADALAGARLVIVAVPSHGLRLVMRAAAPHLPAGAVLVSATKGIETDTLARMSEVMTAETHGRHPVVVLSGPSFAAEVARRLPTALVAASSDRAGRAAGAGRPSWSVLPALRVR